MTYLNCLAFFDCDYRHTWKLTNDQMKTLAFEAKNYCVCIYIHHKDIYIF